MLTEWVGRAIQGAQDAGPDTARDVLRAIGEYLDGQAADGDDNRDAGSSDSLPAIIMSALASFARFATAGRPDPAAWCPGPLPPLTRYKWEDAMADVAAAQAGEAAAPAGGGRPGTATAPAAPAGPVVRASPPPASLARACAAVAGCATLLSGLPALHLAGDLSAAETALADAARTAAAAAGAVAVATALAAPLARVWTPHTVAGARLGGAALAAIDGVTGDLVDRVVTRAGEAALPPPGLLAPPAALVASAVLAALATTLAALLTDGGPTRSFTPEDAALVAEDVAGVRALFVAGLPAGAVDGALAPLTQAILPLMRLPTPALAARSSRAALTPLAHTRGRGANGDDPGLLLRVLAHRADRAASKAAKELGVPREIGGEVGGEVRALAAAAAGRGRALVGRAADTARGWLDRWPGRR